MAAQMDSPQPMLRGGNFMGGGTFACAFAPPIAFASKEDPDGSVESLGSLGSARGAARGAAPLAKTRSQQRAALRSQRDQHALSAHALRPPTRAASKSSSRKDSNQASLPLLGKVMQRESADEEYELSRRFAAIDPHELYGFYLKGRPRRVSADPRALRDSAGGALEVRACWKGSPDVGPLFRDAAMKGEDAGDNDSADDDDDDDDDREYHQDHESGDESPSQLYQVVMHRADSDLERALLAKPRTVEDLFGHLRALRTLFEGVLVYHAHGLVHLDIKSANIVVFKAGAAKAAAQAEAAARAETVSRDGKKRRRSTSTSTSRPRPRARSRSDPSTSASSAASPATAATAATAAAASVPQHVLAHRMIDFGLSFTRDNMDVLCTHLEGSASGGVAGKKDKTVQASYYATSLNSAYFAYPLLANVYFSETQRPQQHPPQHQHYKQPCFHFPHGPRDAPQSWLRSAAQKREDAALSYGEWLPRYDAAESALCDDEDLRASYGLMQRERAGRGGKGGKGGKGRELLESMKVHWAVACATDVYGLGIVLAHILFAYGGVVFTDEASKGASRRDLRADHGPDFSAAANASSPFAAWGPLLTRILHFRIANTELLAAYDSALAHFERAARQST